MTVPEVCAKPKGMVFEPIDLKQGTDFNHIGLKVWKQVWILETRSGKEYQKTTNFGQGLENQSAHPHQKFCVVVLGIGQYEIKCKFLLPDPVGLWSSRELVSVAAGCEVCLIPCVLVTKFISFLSVKWSTEFKKLDRLFEEDEFWTG